MKIRNVVLSQQEKRACFVIINFKVTVLSAPAEKYYLQITNVKKQTTKENTISSVKNKYF